MKDKPLMRVLGGERQQVPPVWMMRQAGRYLPEYRAIRASAASFLDFCYTPELAIEATLQPIRRFGFDAAILFSDILVIPDALGQGVRFAEGEGPRLDAIEDPAGLARLAGELDLERLKPVYAAITGLKAQLAADVALLGFCGAPFTLATYMIAGRGTPDQAPARLFAYRYPEAFAGLIALLEKACVTHLSAQIAAGVDAVQIFDSWGGILAPLEFRRWVVEPARRIAEAVRQGWPKAGLIGFPRNAGASYVDYARAAPVDAVGLDWSVDPAWAARTVQTIKPVQGNLDPLALVAGGAALDAAVDHILNCLSARPFIFNLGHGIVPETPIAHVEQMLARVRRAR